jgi:hypothetical protein
MQVLLQGIARVSRRRSVRTRFVAVMALVCASLASLAAWNLLAGARSVGPPAGCSTRLAQPPPR